MTLRGIVCQLGAVLAGTLLLASCGVRLPSEAAKTFRQDVRQTTPRTDGKDPDVMVWMIADKIHTGMVFPYDWLLESGFVPPPGFGNPPYVSLSWGNRTAYVERGLHSPAKFVRALFYPSPSVMELIPINYYVVDVCPHQRIWRKLVPRETGKDLAAFLNDCSVRDSAGRPVVCGTSSWGGGVLLESRHKYFIPRMCNTWTGQTIETMGGSVNPWFGITANGVIRQAEKPHNGYEQIWWGTGLESNKESAEGPQTRRALKSAVN